MLHCECFKKYIWLDHFYLVTGVLLVVIRFAAFHLFFFFLEKKPSNFLITVYIFMVVKSQIESQVKGIGWSNMKHKRS